MGCIIGENNNVQKKELYNDIDDNNLHKNTLNTVKENVIPYISSLENSHLNNSNNYNRNSLFSLNNQSNSNIKNTFQINKIQSINNNNENTENNKINENNNNEINNNNINENSKNNSKENLINKEILILKLSNDHEKNYDTILINENILTSKQNETKIIKDNKTPIIFSFGSGNINENDVSSSSFSSSNPDNEEEEVDFLIEDEINIKPHQFDIEIFNCKFYMKDFKNGNGIFLKIEKNISIEPEVKYTFLIYNNCYVDFIIQSNSNEVFIDVNNKNKEKFKYIEKKSIIIGKSKNNDIVLPYIEGISRIQLTFFYDEINENFFIYDGFYSIENNDVKPSTNGIWLLINSKFEIKNNMVFRTGKTYIKCSIKEINL